MLRALVPPMMARRLAAPMRVGVKGFFVFPFLRVGRWVLRWGEICSLVYGSCEDYMCFWILLQDYCGLELVTAVRS
jgi:hypothetical protein